LEEADTKDVKNRRSMGCNASDPWYGGKVDICGKLKVDPQGHYKVAIDQARLASSTRFKRIWGSKSFLFIKIPSHIRKRTKNQLLDFFQRPFILMGRVYRAFMQSDDTVHMFAASDNFLFDSPDGASDINRFWAFINLHNPISMNCNQVRAGR
jgi:RNA-dependent RNA polymerase